MFTAIGRWFINRLVFFTETSGLLIRTLKAVWQLKSKAKRALAIQIFYRQLYNSGIKATVIVMITSTMLAWLIISQIVYVLPEQRFSIDLFTKGFVLVLLREVGPLIVGIILISRSSVTTTFEIGFMKLTRELESFQSLRIDPALILILPIIVAYPISLIIMLIVFNLGFLFASWLYMLTAINNTPGLIEFISVVRAEMAFSDLMNNLLKALLSGISIALISIQFGVQVKDKYTGISRAVSSSITMQFLILLLINLAISVIIYRY